MKTLLLDCLSDRRMLLQELRPPHHAPEDGEKMIAELKNVDSGCSIPSITEARFGVPATHPPRILMLYGSPRERSYSRLATEEAARLLTAMGADVRIFNPSGCPS
jgi:hypothetical protein